MIQQNTRKSLEEIFAKTSTGIPKNTTTMSGNGNKKIPLKELFAGKNKTTTLGSPTEYVAKLRASQTPQQVNIATQPTSVESDMATQPTAQPTDNRGWLQKTGDFFQKPLQAGANFLGAAAAATGIPGAIASGVNAFRNVGSVSRSLGENYAKNQGDWGKLWGDFMGGKIQGADYTDEKVAGFDPLYKSEDLKPTKYLLPSGKMMEKTVGVGISIASLMLGGEAPAALTKTLGGLGKIAPYAADSALGAVGGTGLGMAEGKDAKTVAKYALVSAIAAPILHTGMKQAGEAYQNRTADISYNYFIEKLSVKQPDGIVGVFDRAINGGKTKTGMNPATNTFEDALGKFRKSVQQSAKTLVSKNKGQREAYEIGKRLWDNNEQFIKDTGELYELEMKNAINPETGNTFYTESIDANNVSSKWYDVWKKNGLINKSGDLNMKDSVVKMMEKPRGVFDIISSADQTTNGGMNELRKNLGKKFFKATDARPLMPEEIDFNKVLGETMDAINEMLPQPMQDANNFYSVNIDLGKDLRSKLGLRNPYTKKWEMSGDKIYKLLKTVTEGKKGVLDKLDMIEMVSDIMGDSAFMTEAKATFGTIDIMTLMQNPYKYLRGIIKHNTGI
jgi:hypothetical protein